MSIEHGKLAYRADFALYGLTLVGLAAALLVNGPRDQWLKLALLSTAGLLGWSGLEYALHRFVLHGLQPFRRWHALHHARPSALICTPTALTAALFGLLVFLPAWVLSDPWSACALTLGLLMGYQAYAVIHHALHHWRVDFAWFRRLQRNHAVHHHAGQPCLYGVTSSFWDRAMGSLPRRRHGPPEGVRQRTDR